MNRSNRSAVTCAAAGLAALLLGPATSRAHAAGEEPSAGSQMTELPTEDPEREPAYTQTGEVRDEAGGYHAAIRDWPRKARVAARAMIDKYGAPTRFTDDALVWIDNGPWVKTVVSRPVPFAKESEGAIEQTVAYRVPDDKVEELARFDGKLSVNAARGELSCRSRSEALNLLALNLADEIVTGRRSVNGARAFYLKTETLAAAGKSSPYTTRLLFEERSTGVR